MPGNLPPQDYVEVTIIDPRDGRMLWNDKIHMPDREQRLDFFCDYAHQLMGRKQGIFLITLDVYFEEMYEKRAEYMYSYSLNRQMIDVTGQR